MRAFAFKSGLGHRHLDVYLLIKACDKWLKAEPAQYFDSSEYISIKMTKTWQISLKKTLKITVFK